MSKSCFLLFVIIKRTAQNGTKAIARNRENLQGFFNTLTSIQNTCINFMLFSGKRYEIPLMKKFMAFFFIFIVIIAGSVSVPRCYVLQPDCTERGTLECPLLAISTQSFDESIPGKTCCMPRNEGPQEEKNSVPIRYLVQFKIELYWHFTHLNIDPPGEWVFRKDLYPPFYDFFTFQQFFSYQFAHFYPPVAIFLQKQSFLI